MKTLLEKPWEYTLNQIGDRYELLVLCGSVGLFEVKHTLTDEEAEAYRKDGEKFIDLLAKKIQYSPDRYNK